MQNLYDKYGMNAYNFKVIHSNLHKDFLRIVEQCYINMISEEEKINIAKADIRIMTNAIRKKISISRKKAFDNGKIDLSNAIKAKKDFDIKRNTNEVYTWKSLNGTSFRANLIDFSNIVGKSIDLIRKAIRKYRSPKCKNKTIYGYYILGPDEK